MANGSEQSQQARGNGFASTPWQGGIWGNNGIGSGSFSTSRDVVGTRDITDSFSSGPSGSGALAASSEADPWGSRSGRWSSTDTTQARALSGNASPSNPRPDAAGLGMNGNSYYPTSSTIAQRGPVGSRPATALDPSTGPFRNAQQVPELVDDNEAVGPYGSLNLDPEQRLGTFAGAQRPGQEQMFFNPVGNGSSRDLGLPSSSRPEPDLTNFSYGSPAANSMHSQRPSLAAAASFSAHNARAYDQTAAAKQTDEAEVVERLGRIALESDLNGAAYRNGTQNFQLNPVSQPWENGQAYQNGFANDAYGNATGFERRGSAVDRSSSAGSTFRAGAGLNSPRGFTAAPQPNGDSWSRPASQGHRMGSEPDQRVLAQQLLQHQPSSFYPNPYYHHSFQSSQPLYNLYSNNLRPGPLAGYGVPIAPYIAASGLPVHLGRDQDPGKGVRSLLLEEFRSSTKSISRYELKDIYGHVVEFCGDQHGSRFIQTKLLTANSDEKEQVFREIEPNAVQLSKDVFGNYVIQKFFEHGNQVQKKILADAMKGKVVDLSKQMYACRVVQRALEHVLVEQQVELTKELEPDILKLVKDAQGNHVVQKVLEEVPRQHLDFVFDCFRGRVSELAIHQFGCRLIQKALERGNEADRAFILKELHPCAHILPSDQYGNYVAQHVICHGEPEDRSKMIKVIMPMVVAYSKQKIPSNVVEACIAKGTLDEKRAIRDQILKAPGNDANRPLFQLMKDQFGNYVLQKLLAELKGEDREILAEQMRPHLPVLKAGGVGKKGSAIERLVSALSTPTNGTTDHTPEDRTPALTPPTSPGSMGGD
ncbi:mRNA binding protein puf3 [Madurella fahalii]|uniref:mRNA binding protein puf3 n=1 Tax=Madurella fahalii TaxID=1157608 RepID=A0ABQ0GQY7_9PEZI